MSDGAFRRALDDEIVALILDTTEEDPTWLSPPSAPEWLAEGLRLGAEEDERRRGVHEISRGTPEAWRAAWSVSEEQFAAYTHQTVADGEPLPTLRALALAREETIWGIGPPKPLTGIACFFGEHGDT